VIQGFRHFLQGLMPMTGSVGELWADGIAAELCAFRSIVIAESGRS